jgi:phosphoribosylformylglycinamidine synthase
VGQVLRIPIGHGEGNYFAPSDMLEKLEANRQVVLRYTDPNGQLGPDWNPNGSVNAIAAICNEGRNVVGMMPHPERACESLLGGVDGRMIFESVVETMARGPAVRQAQGTPSSSRGERPALQPAGRPF